MYHQKNHQEESPQRVPECQRIERDILYLDHIVPINRFMEHVENTRNYRDGHQNQFKTKINQALQRVQFPKLCLFCWMLLAPEHPETIIPDLVGQLPGGGNILPPLAGHQMPENGKNDQSNQHPRSHTMKTGSLLKPQNGKRSMYFETGKGQKNNQRSLCPVPKTFKAFINIYTFHKTIFSCWIFPCHNQSLRYRILCVGWPSRYEKQHAR